MPKKMRQLATKSAILAKFEGGAVKVVDKIDLSEAKTKHVAALTKNLGIDRTCLLALAEGAENAPTVVRAGRNIKSLSTTTVKQLNAFDVLRVRTLLMTKDGLNELLA